VAASSATTSFGACTVYITPSTTSGVASNFSSDRACHTHCCCRFFALSAVICVSGLKRWFISVPEYDSQFCGSRSPQTRSK
jgi:hypothetical protein